MAYDTELADRLREVLAGEAGVSEQRMFGGLAFLLAGRMAVAASGSGGLLVRCDPAATGELLAEQHTEPFEMRGQALAGWLRVQPDGLQTMEELRRWTAVGVAHARSLPPKGAAGR